MSTATAVALLLHQSKAAKPDRRSVRVEKDGSYRDLKGGDGKGGKGTDSSTISKSKAKSSKAKNGKGGKGGMMGSKASSKDGAVFPTRSPTPTVAPVSVSPVAKGAPSPTAIVPPPTASPVIPPEVCVPTAGACVSTADALQTALGNSAASDIVCICDGAVINTETAIMLEQDDITVGCEGTGCTLKSAGTDNNMDIFGDSVTLSGLTFLDGRVEVLFGGNVAIDGNGDHVIRNSVFNNGEAAQIGGNLFVQTDGTLTIEGSVFANGQATEAGGGLYVLNAKELTIRNTLFDGNKAVGTGGGFFSVLDSPDATGQVIVLDNTEFVGNSAAIGGGFFVTQLGTLPKLSVLNSDFNSNVGTDAGGAAAIAQSLDELSLTVKGSTGTDNKSPVCQEFLGFFDDSAQPFCFSASDPFP